MGSDLKIGLAVGLVVLLVVVGYFGYKAASPARQTSERIVVSPSTPVAAIGSTAKTKVGIRSGKPSAVGRSGKSIKPAGKAVAKPKPPARPVVGPRVSVIAPAAVAKPLAGTGGQAGRISSGGGLANKANSPLTHNRFGSPSAPDVIKEIKPAAPARPRPLPGGGATVYVVAEGDSFWTIAQKFYGNGKYAGLIQKANPNTDPRGLRAGQKLKIPAMSSPRRRLSGPAGPSAGPLPGGYREYVVVKGDKGFWNIAQKVYGNGKYWALISKANLGVDSYSLRPGDKLRIPPLAAGKVKPVAAITGTAGARRSSAAGDTYTVKPGDKGFWGVSEKVYGNGKYGGLIAAANPGVDSNNLKVGTVLTIPPLSELPNKGVSAHRKPAASKPGSPSADDSPIFD